MRALDRKLLRDLWQMKGQALAIALVIGAGVAMFVLSLSNFESLRLTQHAYYERYRFAGVFASLKRAPLRLEQRIAEIPGVARVQTRTVVDVTLDVPRMAEPAVGRLISIPEENRDTLNDVYLRRGRYIEPERPDEVLVSEAFAEAHELLPGDSVAAILNGRRRELRIVGVALSPEYVYSIRPGDLLPDPKRFGIFWMGRRALAAAYDLEGGFNDVALALMPGASEQDVIARLDRLVEPYGGRGAVPRALQTSHWYLDNELTQLQTMGLVIPLIFLAVAAFLLNVVLTRIVSVQREQIAALKALGYSSRAIGLHYAKSAILIALVGGAVGIAAGAYLGSGMLSLYNEYFRFPILRYELSGRLVLGSLAVSFLAAVAGALLAVRRAVRLPPAQAMRPEPPASYKVSWLERAGLRIFLSVPARMVVRNLLRRPGRTAVSIIGIAFAGAILIVGTFSLDSIDVILHTMFRVAQRQDLSVSFVEPASSGAFHELQRYPGVMRVQPLRSVPVRLRVGHRSRQIALQGLPADASLFRIVDGVERVVTPPPRGLLLSSKLGEILKVGPGDTVTIEVLEGTRPVREVPVSGLVEEFMGTSVYMSLEALHQLMREGGTLSGAHLLVDGARMDELNHQLKRTPVVAGVAIKDAVIQNFRDTIAQNLGTMIAYNLIFSGIIAFGVVYNSARISLSERSRELASMRVMGFTRAEISKVLLGELAVVLIAAVPVGLLLGYGLAGLATVAFDTELYRIPLIVAPRTWIFASVTVLVAGFLSGLVVRRRLDHLDLIAVLKTKE